MNTNYTFLYITLGCAAQYKDYSEREADKAMGCWFQQCASTIKKTAKINGLPAKANEMCTILICFMCCNYVPYVQYYLLGFTLLTHSQQSCYIYSFQTPADHIICYFKSLLAFC